MVGNPAGKKVLHRSASRAGQATDKTRTNSGDYTVSWTHIQALEVRLLLLYTSLQYRLLIETDTGKQSAVFSLRRGSFIRNNYFQTRNAKKAELTSKLSPRNDTNDLRVLLQTTAHGTITEELCQCMGHSFRMKSTRQHWRTTAVGTLY